MCVVNMRYFAICLSFFYSVAKFNVNTTICLKNVICPSSTIHTINTIKYTFNYTQTLNPLIQPPSKISILISTSRIPHSHRSPWQLPCSKVPTSAGKTHPCQGGRPRAMAHPTYRTNRTMTGVTQAFRQNLLLFLFFLMHRFFGGF